MMELKCELVGTYMLNVLSKKYLKDNFGIYRDGGLAVMKNKSGPQSEQIKKCIQKVFFLPHDSPSKTINNAFYFM